MDHYMKEEYKKQLILSYIQGEATREEIQLLDQLIRSKHITREEINEIEYLWNTSAEITDKKLFDKEKAWNKVSESLFKQEIPPIDTKHKNKRNLSSALLKVAAAIVIIASTSIFAYLHLKTAPAESKISEFSYLEKISEKGEKVYFTLADGTHVWLNGESKLTYPENFHQSLREVYLEGEAYFDVSHDTAKPFIVKTSHINIRVLGTEFNVTSYPGDEKIETVLVKGKVKVENTSDKSTLVLEPSHSATFNKKDGSIHKKPANTDIYTSWRGIKLHFENEAFEDIVIRLEKWYGVDIYVEDEKLKKQRFSGEFENETLEEVLQIVNYTTRITFFRTDGKIIIKPQK